VRRGDGEDDRRCLVVLRKGVAGFSPKLNKGAKLGEQDLGQGVDPFEANSVNKAIPVE